MKNVQITYYLDGCQYSEIFTIKEAREALVWFGYPKAKYLSDNEIAKALNTIYNG